MSLQSSQVNTPYIYQLQEDPLNLQGDGFNASFMNEYLNGIDDSQTQSDIEKIKLHIFLNLFSIANGKMQTSFQDELIMADLIDSPDKPNGILLNTPLQNSIPLSKSIVAEGLKDINSLIEKPGNQMNGLSSKVGSIANQSHRFRTLKDADNFYDYRIKIPNGVGGVMSDIYSVVSELFFGSQLRGGQKDQLKLQQLEKMLQDSKDSWNGTIVKNGNNISIKGWHAKPFQNQLDRAFSKAKKLLDQRKTAQILTDYLRITFFSFLIITAVGKLISCNQVSILGVIASSITLLFMGIHYGMSSFKQTQTADNLKNCLEKVYISASNSSNI